MECNKGEALRAKELAEKKMENKDFFGARKIAIKAQNLYPGLENISQLIMVCDVHCSAENKILGTEMDWYGILKLEPTADNVLIKKQFRKFALYLHPDKNKFAGAADAFKLIGEAQRVLLDQVKRKMHDVKRKSAVVIGASNQASRPSSVQKPQNHENNSVNSDRQFPRAPQTAQTGSNSNSPTFWTACPNCLIRYQYFRKILHQRLYCRNCQKTFTAYEVKTQDNSNQSASLKHTGDQNQAPCKVGPPSNAGFSTTKAEVWENTCSSEVAQGSKPNGKAGDVSMNFNQKRKAEIRQPCGKMNEKKMKQFFECSKSFNNEDSTKAEEDGITKKHPFPKEVLPNKGNETKKRSEDGKPSEDAKAELKTFIYPDAVLSDFDKNREENSFAFGPCSTFATDTMETVPNIHVDVSDNQAEQKICSESCVDLSRDEEDQNLQSDVHSNIFENPTGDAGSVPDSSEDAYEIPDPEFCNFDAIKSLENFEIGQVWAIYCDEDGMPKYYGLIKKIDQLPKFKLHVAWLSVCSTSNSIIQWIDKKIPITCGRFKLKRMKLSEYTCTAAFSHRVGVRVEGRGNKQEYVILPRKGEIWALYKSWNVNMKCSDLENCDYDIVEVVEESQSGITVLSLEEVNGFKSVFRARVKRQHPVTFVIPANELLRFSHKIPAFRLTEERGGSLRGYLELDPAAFPFHWFCKD